MSVRNIVLSSLFRESMETAVWQVLSKVINVAAMTWAIRCLGPEKMGIAAMVIAAVLQLALLGTIISDVYVIRCYRNMTTDMLRLSLIQSVFTFRTACVTVALSAVFIVLAFVGIADGWRLAILAGIPLLILSANSPTWILASQDKTSINFKYQAFSSLVTAALYVTFFRPGIMAGADIVVLCAGQLVVFAFGWRAALRDFHAFPFKLSELRHVPRLVWAGRWLAFTAILSYLVNYFEVPLVGYLASVTDAGFYRTAFQLAGTLDPFIYSASLVLFPKLIAWRAYSPALLRSKLKTLFAIMGLPLLLIIPVAYFLLPSVFCLMYGSAFAKGGLPFAVLTISKLLTFSGVAFGFGLWAQERDALMFFLALPAAVVGVTANIILIPRFGMVAAAIVNLCISCMMLVATACLSLGKFDKDLSGLAVSSAPPVPE